MKVGFCKVLIIAAVVAIAGCGSSTVDVDQLVDDAVANSVETQQQTAKIDISGDFKITTPEGETSEGDLAFVIDGYFGKTEDRRPKFDATVVGQFSLKEQSEEINGNLNLMAKMDENALYVNINSFPERLLASYVGSAEAFIGKWWKFTHDDELIETFKPALTVEQEAALNILIKETEFFTDLKDKGMEVVNGKNAHHLVGKLSQEGLMVYIEEMSALSENPVIPQEKAQLEQVLALLAGSDIEIWITEDDHYLVRFAVEFGVSLADLADQLDAPEAEVQSLPNGEVNLKLVVDITEPNVEKDIEIPVDVEEFNPQEFAAEAFGAEGLDPAAFGVEGFDPAAFGAEGFEIPVSN